MKIAIMSDSHDHHDNFQKAIKIANEGGCEHLLFGGDLIAPGWGAEALSKFNGKVDFVFGNNDGEVFAIKEKFDLQDNLNISNRGRFFEGEIDGVRIFMNHYPRIGQIAAHSGLFDLVVYGDDHTYHEEKIGNCLLVNPGAIHPYKIEFASFVIFDTADKSVKKVVL